MTDPAVLQVLQALQAANQQMAQAMGQQQQQLNAQQVATAQQTQQMADLVASMGSRSQGVVDVRQIGKPDNLKGSKDQICRAWKDWAYTFETWFCSQFANGRAALKWAREEGSNAIDQAAINHHGIQENWTDLDKINAQLQVALVSLCKDESLTVVRNSERDMGLDAWRRLHREHEPNNPQANLRLLKKVLQPAQQSIDNLRSATETWEQMYKQYRDRTGEDLSDNVCKLTLQSMCPTSLQEHLDFHSGRLLTYDLLKAEVDAYLDVKHAAALAGGGGATPMDLDTFHKGKKAKGGKKGGGK